MTDKKGLVLITTCLVLIAWFGAIVTVGQGPDAASLAVVPGATPFLKATPNPVPRGQDHGKTTIEWDVGRSDRGQVKVSVNGGASMLFASGPRGSAVADWIETGSTYVFQLYDDDPTVALATTRVARAEPRDSLLIAIGWMVVLVLGALIMVRAGLRARSMLARADPDP